MSRNYMNKTLGIIGGFGPETTAEFYLSIIFGCKERGAVNRPHIIISNPGNLIEYEDDFIRANSGTERFIPILTETARELERAGASFIALPCNSLHKFIEEIRASVKIPVLSIVEETCKCMKANHRSKVGLLSTAATIENRVYEDKFAEFGISFAVPDERRRSEMNAIIKRLVDGERLSGDREKILEIISDFKENEKVDGIVLACTDLQLLSPTDEDVAVFDTMDILSKAAIGKLLSE